MTPLLLLGLAVAGGVVGGGLFVAGFWCGVRAERAAAIYEGDAFPAEGSDRSPRVVARPAGAPVSAANDTAREAWSWP